MDANRLDDLLNRLVDEALPDTDGRNLEQLLLESAEARELFWQHARLHSLIRDYYESQPIQQCIDVASGRLGPIAEAEKEADGDAPNAPLSGSPSLLGSMWSSSLAYVSSGWPVAYLIATLIFGLGVLVGSFVYVSQPATIAGRHHVRPSSPSTPSAVGRVVNMVDCEWQEVPRFKTQGFGKNEFRLGDKFVLTSGYLEMAYESGAKVILQGPVAFEVSSDDGGYLSLGRLTAKIEKVAGTADAVNRSVDRSAAVSHSLFTVHTPTAVVTDLGTEFGVEVDRQGVTDLRVFVGSVKIARSDDPADRSTEQVVYAGKAVRVDATKRRPRSIPLNDRQFVRTLPARTDPEADNYGNLVLSMEPVVYYRMETWPKDETDSCRRLIDSAPGVHHGKAFLDRAFSPWCRGRFGNALDLHGSGVGDYAIVPDYPQTDNDQLTVSAWVWASSLAPDAGIIQNWSSSETLDVTIGQFALAVHNNRHLLAAVHQPNGEQVTVIEASQPLPCHEWCHVAMVADGSLLRLYRNGVEVGSAAYDGIARQQPVRNLSIGCTLDASGAKPRSPGQGFWDGRLDEICIFNRALTPAQVQQLYSGKGLRRSGDDSSERF